jgi:hypothetical protein
MTNASGKSKRKAIIALLTSVLLMSTLSCEGASSPTDQPPTQTPDRGAATVTRTPRLALWLANKDELIAHESATYDLVMAGLFEPAEADAIKSRNPSAKLLAGLSHTWILEDAGWLDFLLTVANHGDSDGPLRITEDMYLMLDDDGDGTPDRKCSLPEWDGLYAMDPRHPG